MCCSETGIVHQRHAFLRYLFWCSPAAALVFAALGTLQILRGTSWRRVTSA